MLRHKVQVVTLPLSKISDRLHQGRPPAAAARCSMRIRARRPRIGEALVDVPRRQCREAQRQSAGGEGLRIGQQVADHRPARRPAARRPRQVMIHSRPVSPARVFRRGSGQEGAANREAVRNAEVGIVLMWMESLGHPRVVGPGNYVESSFML